jgi:hypothetical protein
VRGKLRKTCGASRKVASTEVRWGRRDAHYTLLRYGNPVHEVCLVLRMHEVCCRPCRMERGKAAMLVFPTA